MGYLKARTGWRSSSSDNKGNVVNNLTLGQASHAGLFLGCGTSASAKTTSTASQKMASFYTSNSATSGTSVGLYWKHTVTGIAGSGVTGRLYTYANVAAALLVGAQITAETGAAGKVSGLMVGCRSQVSFADDATAAPTGTIAGGQSELYFNGDNSSTTDVTTSSRCSLHRFLVDGDTTARAKVNLAFEFANISAGSGATYMADTAFTTPGATSIGGLHVMINDTTYRIPYYA